jgi:hypothetical protein
MTVTLAPLAKTPPPLVLPPMDGDPFVLIV